MKLILLIKRDHELTTFGCNFTPFLRSPETASFDSGVTNPAEQVYHPRRNIVKGRVWLVFLTLGNQVFNLANKHPACILRIEPIWIGKLTQYLIPETLKK
jgi:hypothetical protein